MALSRVEVSRDVLQTCMAHALTTEREEVMGLLLGDIEVRRRVQRSHAGRAHCSARARRPTW